MNAKETISATLRLRKCLECGKSLPPSPDNNIVQYVVKPLDPYESLLCNKCALKMIFHKKKKH